MVSLLPHIETYRNREITFQYRKRNYFFSLSLDLFSSAGIDTGSRFLLKIFSEFLDECYAGPGAAGRFNGEPPFTVLDSGCGAGLLGICAAGALSALVPPEAEGASPDITLRAQDRDELARIFTEYNAERNGLSGETFEVHTEALLAGPPGQKWDLILTNIPAKAGLPVLEDFIARSAGLLKKNGLVFLVAVNTLADFFRSRINAAASPVREANGKEHTVFVYGRRENDTETCDTIIFDDAFPVKYPFYIRNRDEYRMEDISYHLDTVHGAPDFDSPGGAIQAAAKLAVKIDLAEKLAALPAPAGDTGKAGLLVHDAGQGHFGLWLAHYLNAANSIKYRWVLSGRNILALAAAGAALRASGISSSMIPATDIFLDHERPGTTALDRNRFAFIAFFPETVPDTGTAWEGIHSLAVPGAVVIAGMPSSEAERFDRKKPPSFTRLGDLKRNGFRALAYRHSYVPFSNVIILDNLLK